MNNLLKPFISLLSVSLSVCTIQALADEIMTNEVSMFINRLPQDIGSMTDDYMEEAGNPYGVQFTNLVSKYKYQYDTWPSDAVKIASKYIRFEMCKEKSAHYLDFSKDIKSIKKTGRSFTFTEIAQLNNGSYFIDFPLSPKQGSHPYKGPIQLAFQEGWNHQGDYKIKEYFNACLEIPLSGYIDGFEKHGLSVFHY